MIFLPHIAVKALFLHKRHRRLIHRETAVLCLLFGMNFLFGSVAQAYDIVFMTNNYQYADEQRNKR